MEIEISDPRLGNAFQSANKNTGEPLAQNRELLLTPAEISVIHGSKVTRATSAMYLLKQINVVVNMLVKGVSIQNINY